MRMHIQYDTSPEIVAQNLVIPTEGNLPADPSNDIIKLQDVFCHILTIIIIIIIKQGTEKQCPPKRVSSCHEPQLVLSVSRSCTQKCICKYISLKIQQFPAWEGQSIKLNG